MTSRTIEKTDVSEWVLEPSQSRVISAFEDLLKRLEGCMEEVCISIEIKENYFDLEIALQYLASTRDGKFWIDQGECSYNYRLKNIEVRFF
jgi:hypothetical protein